MVGVILIICMGLPFCQGSGELQTIATDYSKFSHNAYDTYVCTSVSVYIVLYYGRILPPYFESRGPEHALLSLYLRPWCIQFITCKCPYQSDHRTISGHCPDHSTI